MLSSRLIILCAVLQNTLYIYNPFNPREISVRFDDNNGWIKMMPYTVINNSNSVPTFTTSIPSNVTKYQVQIRFQNSIIAELDWITLESSVTEPNNSYSTSTTESSVVGLLCYLVVCSSILLLKCLIKITKGKKCMLLVRN